MRNTYGNAVSVTIFGESHGEMIGAVIDGIPAGIKIDIDFIKTQLNRRRTDGQTGTQRAETDEFNIVSGLLSGKTTGTPLTILIKNAEQKSKDYTDIKTKPRPSHADYTAEIKYHGSQDYRGGGHFSGRVTAAMVAAGAIAIQILNAKGISFFTHILSCAGVTDETATEENMIICDEGLPVINRKAAEGMREGILKAKAEGDSVGGVVETVITGMPVGVGEPWFDTVEGELAKVIFSVPAVKGVEFGIGFAGADKNGSEFNDAFYYDETGTVKTRTNNNGGINGGITNGMPIVIKTMVKPTPSIYKEQRTVNLAEKADTTITIEGRHDPAILQRGAVVIESAAAIAILDLLAQHLAQEAIAKGVAQWADTDL